VGSLRQPERERERERGGARVAGPLLICLGQRKKERGRLGAGGLRLGSRPKGGGGETPSWARNRREEPGLQA